MTLAPELLAPAGDILCAKAAVENGADAVYFGLDRGFNARARATNISFESLPELMSLLHGRCVKGYVTMNTLVFSDELAEFEKTIRKIAEAGVDAVLVQDFGMIRLIRELAPNLGVHASTQMTMTSAECISTIESLGVQRVVLARELSIEEIEKIAKQTPIEVEVFAHGALCVAYSGQCMTSESLGGRSANRGQCAQACRLPYDLICDGEDVELGLQKFLLSPQDLAAFDLVPKLIEAGVRSLKIEGRLKTPEYVANITRHYRVAIDSAVQGLAKQFSDEEVEQMELSFSRGFSPGWLQGCDHKMLVPATSSAKRGVRIGTVERVGTDRVTIELERAISAGDGVMFAETSHAENVQGGRIFQVFRGRQPIRQKVENGVIDITFPEESIDFSKLQVGMVVWKTDDPRLTKQLRKSFSSEHPQRRIPIKVAVTAKSGRPLEVRASFEGLVGRETVRLATDSPLETARKHPLTTDVLREQFGRLGKTYFELGDLSAKIEGEPMVPLSVLGTLRKELVAKLTQKLGQDVDHSVTDRNVLEDFRPDLPKNETTNNKIELTVLCRSLEQIEFAIEAGVDRLYADFSDIRLYKDAVRIGRETRKHIAIATPRIHKPDENGIFTAMLRHQPETVLVRNFAGLRYFRENKVPVVGDFSLNIANEVTARQMMEEGLQRITASYDLNRGQLIDLIRNIPRDWPEIVIHQHMPMFHMEHCVFCAVLSPGTNKTNCGRPCDDHVVKLRDRVGMEHLLTADVGCRNTLYNAKPQSAAEAVPQLLREGVRWFRIEMLGNESKTQTTRCIELYRDLLSGSLTADAVWSELQASNRVGVTRGTMEDRKNPLAIL